MRQAIIGATCGMHGAHHPLYTYCERHHIIPQAWQKTWQPAGFDPANIDHNLFPYALPSPDQPGLVLWDARTVDCCRTGHGNTHIYIVHLAHTMRDSGVTDPKKLASIIRKASGSTDTGALSFATQTIIRSQEVGLDFPSLWAHGEWGEI